MYCPGWRFAIGTKGISDLTDQPTWRMKDDVSFDTLEMRIFLYQLAQTGDFLVFQQLYVHLWTFPLTLPVFCQFFPLKQTKTWFHAVAHFKSWINPAGSYLVKNEASWCKQICECSSKFNPTRRRSNFCSSNLKLANNFNSSLLWVNFLRCHVKVFARPLEHWANSSSVSYLIDKKSVIYLIKM